MGVPEVGLRPGSPRGCGGLRLAGQPVPHGPIPHGPVPHGPLPLSSDAVHAPRQDPAAARVCRVFREQGNHLPPGAPSPLGPGAGAQLVGVAEGLWDLSASLGSAPRSVRPWMRLRPHAALLQMGPVIATRLFSGWGGSTVRVGMKSSSWGPLGAWGHLAGVRNLALLPSDSLEQLLPLGTVFLSGRCPWGAFYALGLEVETRVLKNPEALLGAGT